MKTCQTRKSQRNLFTRVILVTCLGMLTTAASFPTFLEVIRYDSARLWNPPFLGLGSDVITAVNEDMRIKKSEQKTSVITKKKGGAVDRLAESLMAEYAVAVSA